MGYRAFVAGAGRWIQRAVGSVPRGLSVTTCLALVALLCAVARPAGSPFHAFDPLQIGVADPVYTLAAVERALARDPRAWVGRMVRVQGRVAIGRTWSPPDSIVTRLVLVDPGYAAGVWPLDLQWGRPDPWLAALRRLPLLGRLVPPQRLHVGRLGIYRVRLCAPTGWAAGCAGAVLLDADPNYH